MRTPTIWDWKDTAIVLLCVGFFGFMVYVFVVGIPEESEWAAACEKAGGVPVQTIGSSSLRCIRVLASEPR